MKSLRIPIMALGLFLSLAASAQTVEEVIDKHLDAMGGKDKLANLKSVRMETNLSVQGMDIPVIITKVQDLGQRVDISAMGSDGYLITTPTAGWTYMPFMGQTAAEPMPDEQVKQGKDELDIQGPLFNYKEKGHKVELLGKEDVDGTSCYKIKLTTKDSVERTYFMDPTSYYIIKMVAKAFVMGQEQEVAVNFSDYQKTEEGYVFAHVISGAFGQGDMTVTKVEVNKPVDEKLFKPSN